MSTFNGGGGDLSSTQTPAALLELLTQIQDAEETGANLLTTLTINTETNQITFAGTFGITNYSPATAGTSATFTVANYLAGVTGAGAFDPGSGGDLSATNLIAALAQLLKKFQSEQGSTNRLTTYSFTANALTGIGTCTYGGTLPFSFALSGGQPVLTATDF